MFKRSNVQISKTTQSLSLSVMHVMPISGLIESGLCFRVDISPTPPSLPMADSHNSARNLTADSSATNFAAIFEAASNNYKTLVGQDLRTHPLALELESGNSSPDSILAVFRKQAQALDKFRNGDDKLIKSLTPIVNILSTFSTTADIGLVSPRCFLYAGSNLFLAILAHHGDLHWYWCSSRGESFLRFFGAHFRNF